MLIYKALSIIPNNSLNIFIFCFFGTLPYLWVMGKQLKYQVKLSDTERNQFDKLDNLIGMAGICSKLDMKKSTYYNLLNTGNGREDNIDKVKGLIKANRMILK